MVLVVGKVKGGRELSLIGDKLHAVLLVEATLSHGWQDAEPLKHPERFGNQLLADVISGEPLPLEEQHGMAMLGNERGGGGPSGTTTDHHDIRIYRL